MSQSLPKMQVVTHAANQLNLPYSASQLHGFLCGFLCAGSKLDERAFIKSLLAETKNASDEAIATVASLYQVSKTQLQSMSFEFHLLISDELPLPERAKALGLWCDGFGQGLSDADVDFSALTEQEAKDALLHIHEIAEIDYENTSVTEDDEKAFFEIFEYVRMAVLMIHSTLNAPKQGNIKKGNETLH